MSFVTWRERKIFWDLFAFDENVVESITIKPSTLQSIVLECAQFLAPR